jgi:hypothetical protein
MENNNQTPTKDLTVEEQLAPLAGPYDLTNGQLQWLLEKMSSDDQKMVKDKMKTCAREQFLTRGRKYFKLILFSIFTLVPISAAITASVYIARKRLPDKLHIGPKNPWIFTGIIGVASFIFANMLTFGTCLDRTRSTLVDLYKKVSILCDIFQNMILV